MTLQSEAELEFTCCEIADREGWLHIKLDRAARSWPDRLFFLPYGQTWLVEFKLPNERVRKQQLANHRKLAQLDHPVSVIRSVRQFRSLAAERIGRLSLLVPE